jgi:hypothetical protein
MERCTTAIREPWNKGKLVGQKAPLKLKEIWAIRVRLQLANRRRELALFNLAIDSKLRACDMVNLRVRDVCHGGGMASRAIVLQQKTQRPVQFETTEPTREAVSAWISHAGLTAEHSLFRAGFADRLICPLASTLELSILGSSSSVSTVLTTGRTRCGAPRRR